MTAIDPCPFDRPWCTQGEQDDGTHICQGEDHETPAGWSLILKDFHEDGEPEIDIADPDRLLTNALVGRLSLDAAYDLMIALATVLRDAHKPTASAAPVAA